MALLQMGTNTGTQGGTVNTQQTVAPNTTVSPQSTVAPNTTINPMDVRYSSGGSTPLGATTQPSAPVADPYAAWGGTAAYNSLVSGFDGQKQSIFSSANDAATNSGIGLRNSILDFIDSMRTGQSAIDNRGVGNELAKQRGVSDVNASVGRGIRSGGVILNNKNASDSSASDAIARAYGDIGRRQMSDIGNQYELENQEIGLAQTDLERQRASGTRRIEGSREQTVNAIVADANDKLAALDAAMANASLPQRIAIDAEKNKVRSQVLGILDGYDNELGQVNDVRAMDGNARIAEATRRGALGQASPQQFNYSGQAPAAFADTGPFSSELPIFSYRNNEE